MYIKSLLPHINYLILNYINVLDYLYLLDMIYYITIIYLYLKVFTWKVVEINVISVINIKVYRYVQF